MALVMAFIRFGSAVFGGDDWQEDVPAGMDFGRPHEDQSCGLSAQPIADRRCLRTSLRVLATLMRSRDAVERAEVSSMTARSVANGLPRQSMGMKLNRQRSVCSAWNCPTKVADRDGDFGHLGNSLLVLS